MVFNGSIPVSGTGGRGSNPLRLTLDRQSTAAVMSRKVGAVEPARDKGRGTGQPQRERKHLPQWRLWTQPQVAPYPKGAGRGRPARASQDRRIVDQSGATNGGQNPAYYKLYLENNLECPYGRNWYTRQVESLCSVRGVRVRISLRTLQSRAP